MTWWETLLFPVAWLWRPNFSSRCCFRRQPLLIVFNWATRTATVPVPAKLSRKDGLQDAGGELAMTTVPGVAPVLWSFTVWDENVAKKLDGQMGSGSSLHQRVSYIPRPVSVKPLLRGSCRGSGLIS